MTEFLHVRQFSNTNHNRKSNVPHRDNPCSSTGIGHLDKFLIARQTLNIYRDRLPYQISDEETTPLHQS